MQAKEDKLAYLARELEAASEESGKARVHLESLQTEVRALEDDLEQGKRARKSLMELVDTLEGEKQQLESKVQVLRDQ